MRLSLVVGVISLLSIIGCDKATSKKPSVRLKQIHKLLGERKYWEADEALGRFRESNPDEPAVQYFRALIEVQSAIQSQLNDRNRAWDEFVKVGNLFSMAFRGGLLEYTDNPCTGIERVAYLPKQQFEAEMKECMLMATNFPGQMAPRAYQAVCASYLRTFRFPGDASAWWYSGWFSEVLLQQAKGAKYFYDKASALNPQLPGYDDVANRHSLIFELVSAEYIKDPSPCTANGVVNWLGVYITRDNQYYIKCLRGVVEKVLTKQFFNNDGAAEFGKCIIENTKRIAEILHTYKKPSHLIERRTGGRYNVRDGKLNVEKNLDLRFQYLQYYISDACSKCNDPIVFRRAMKERFDEEVKLMAVCIDEFALEGDPTT